MTDRADADLPVPLQTPLERLQQSRARMRTYLLPAVRQPRGGHGDEGGASGLVGRLGDKLGEWRDHPLVGAVIDAVEGWWAHHPLRSVSDIGTTAARELAGPLVRRHPVASVAGALVVGALLVRIKPWRWVLKPALFAGLTTHVVTRLLSDAPMEFVLNALMKLRPHPTAPHAGPADAERAPESPPPSTVPPAAAASYAPSEPIGPTPARDRVTEPSAETAVPP